jgi:glycosyltransferase involved in cell wall biosynthesis
VEVVRTVKVAFDVAQTCVERAGCSWYADALARALASVPGVELTLLHHFGTWCNHATHGGTTIEGVSAPLRALDEDAARAFWSEVARGGLPGRPDVVHSNCFDAPALPGSRLVYTIHDVSFWTHPRFCTESTRLVCQRGMLDALERAAGLAFVSEATRDEFERVLPGWLETTRRPTAILPGASRHGGGLRDAAAERGPWLCIGSIEPRKNHATLLDAYEAYRKTVPAPRELVLVGSSGWHNEEIHARLRALGPESGVRHVGYVDDLRLRELYASAFCLVCPSWYEGFGLPVVEAFAYGLPVVCSDIPSLREVGGDAPCFFTASDARSLSRTMVELDCDSRLSASAADRSRARHEVFAWRKTAERAVAFYRQLMAQPDPAYS